MSFRDAPFPPLRAVGTDIVDLADPRCAQKASDTRFLDRVLTDAERRTVRAAGRDTGTGRVPEALDARPGPASADAPEPVSPADVVLWRIWALKEAAFKAVTGVLGAPPVFEHRAFAVRFLGGPERGAAGRPGGTGGGTDDGTGGGPDGGPLEAVVRWHDRSVRGRVLPTGARGFVHALACVERGGRTEPSLHPGRNAGACWSPDHLRWGRARLPSDQADVPADRFTERERRSVHSAASARVRLHARRDLAEWVDVPEEELELVCAEGPVGRMPPRILHRGEPAPWGVALSHHGRWLAWLLAR